MIERIRIPIQEAHKHVDPVDPDPDPQTLILTSRSGEEDTASWARLSRRLWERLSEVRWPKEARLWEERAVRRLWARESISRD
jgi:hypothetical protein